MNKKKKTETRRISTTHHGTQKHRIHEHAHENDQSHPGQGVEDQRTNAVRVAATSADTIADVDIVHVIVARVAAVAADDTVDAIIGAFTHTIFNWLFYQLALTHPLTLPLSEALNPPRPVRLKACRCFLPNCLPISPAKPTPC